MAKYHPRAVNMAAPQENFAEYYSFDKKNKVGPREGMVGVDKWDKKYRSNADAGCPYPETAPKERAYKDGKASTFCHTKPSGKLRVSGTPGAHRIGKR